MKALCIILGIILIVGGVGIRLAVDTNEDVREASEMLQEMGMEKISPSLVKELMKDGVNTGFYTLTLDDILSTMDADEAAQIKTGLTLYSNSTLIAIIGAVLVVIGIAIPKRRQQQRQQQQYDFPTW